jgi:hypothetical protein
VFSYSRMRGKGQGNRRSGKTVSPSPTQFAVNPYSRNTSNSRKKSHPLQFPPPLPLFSPVQILWPSFPSRKPPPIPLNLHPSSSEYALISLNTTYYHFKPLWPLEAPALNAKYSPPAKSPQSPPKSKTNSAGYSRVLLQRQQRVKITASN